MIHDTSAGWKVINRYGFRLVEISETEHIVMRNGKVVLTDPVKTIGLASDWCLRTIEAEHKAVGFGWTWAASLLTGDVYEFVERIDGAAPEKYNAIGVAIMTKQIEQLADSLQAALNGHIDDEWRARAWSLLSEVHS